MYIRVFPPDGTVTVSSSFEFKEDEIRLFVLNKLPEITKARNKMLSQLRQSKREYVSGETLYVWGKQYFLQVEYSNRKNTLDFSGDRAILTVRKESTAKQRESFVNEWYRERLKAEIEKGFPDGKALQAYIAAAGRQNI